MAVDGEYAGHIVISDLVKPHAKEAVAELKKPEVKKTVMLTEGFAEAAERNRAETLEESIEVYSELLPEIKSKR